MAAMRNRRNTPQRQAVLETLCSLDSHPTAAELHLLVRRRIPRISLGTIYRNLEVLHHDGLVMKLSSAGTEARYDGRTTPHHHLRCTVCRRVEDLAPDAQPVLPLPAKELQGFRVEGYRLEYLGVCRECRTGRDNGGEAAGR